MTHQVIKLNTKGWKILTPVGFESFNGISFNGNKQTILIAFTDGSTIGVTPNHILFKNNQEIIARAVKPGMVLDGVPTNKKVVSIWLDTVTPVFDILHTTSHKYVSSGVVSHNCALLSSDPLLIDSMKAAQLKSTEPVTQEIGVKIWKQFEKQDKQTYQQPSMADNYNLHNGWHNPMRMQKAEVLEYEKQCIITVDPSKGVGKDFTVVEVFSYPELDQMMELRSNKSKTGDIYIALKRIWEKAHDAGWQVFFTVENNGVGEGLIALFENDSELPDNVELVSEVGQVGLNTSRKSKALGCKVFKEFVESGKLKLHSKILIEEIKNFVLIGGSYEAKEGSTDDCVMSTVLACRVVHQLAAYDDQAFDMLYSVEESEESIHEFDNEGDDNEGGSDYVEMPMVF